MLNELINSKSTISKNINLNQENLGNWWGLKSFVLALPSSLSLSQETWHNSPSGYNNNMGIESEKFYGNPHDSMQKSASSLFYTKELCKGNFIWI